MGLSEKEAVRLVRESFSEGLTKQQVTRNLQSKGYKLEYIDSLISRARRPRKILIISIVILLIIIPSFLAGYLFFYQVNSVQIDNPLAGYKLVQSQNEKSNNTNETKEITFDEVEITPEFISYLLYSIGAGELKKNPITQEKPKILTEIDELKYYSKVSKGKVETFEEEIKNPDIFIKTKKEIIVEAIFSSNPKEIFKESFETEESLFELKVSEAELFTKGYLNLYENLK